MLHFADDLFGWKFLFEFHDENDNLHAVIKCHKPNSAFNTAKKIMAKLSSTEEADINLSERALAKM